MDVPSGKEVPWVIVDSRGLFWKSMDVPGVIKYGMKITELHGGLVREHH